MATDAEIQELVRAFPAVFETAVADWAKYQAALLTGKVEPWKREKIHAWFYQFPRFWATIRPNLPIFVLARMRMSRMVTTPTAKVCKSI